MPFPDDNRQTAPWLPFKFLVEFTASPLGAPEGSAEPLCGGAFSEVTGIEATMEPKAIKEGGANYGVHQRAGQVSFATVILKRGMTQARDLWQWWAIFAGADASRPNGAFAHRLTARITMLGPDGEPAMKWRLERAMPVKFKAADMNARAAEVGIEELHLVHEGLYFESVGTAA